MLNVMFQSTGANAATQECARGEFTGTWLHPAFLTANMMTANDCREEERQEHDESHLQQRKHARVGSSVPEARQRPLQMSKKR
jgi:hypothetical protein